MKLQAIFSSQQQATPSDLNYAYSSNGSATFQIPTDQYELFIKMGVSIILQAVQVAPQCLKVIVELLYIVLILAVQL